MSTLTPRAIPSHLTHHPPSKPPFQPLRVHPPLHLSPAIYLLCPLSDTRDILSSPHTSDTHTHARAHRRPHPPSLIYGHTLHSSTQVKYCSPGQSCTHFCFLLLMLASVLTDGDLQQVQTKRLKAEAVQVFQIVRNRVLQG